MHDLAPAVLLEASQVMHDELVVVNLKYKHTIVEEYLNKEVTVAASNKELTLVCSHR